MNYDIYNACVATPMYTMLTLHTVIKETSLSYI